MSPSIKLTPAHLTPSALRYVKSILSLDVDAKVELSEEFFDDLTSSTFHDSIVDISKRIETNHSGDKGKAFQDAVAETLRDIIHSDSTLRCLESHKITKAGVQSRAMDVLLAKPAKDFDEKRQTIDCKDVKVVFECKWTISSAVIKTNNANAIAELSALKPLSIPAYIIALGAASDNTSTIRGWLREPFRDGIFSGLFLYSNLKSIDSAGLKTPKLYKHCSMVILRSETPLVRLLGIPCESTNYIVVLETFENSEVTMVLAMLCQHYMLRYENFEALRALSWKVYAV